MGQCRSPSRTLPSSLNPSTASSTTRRIVAFALALAVFATGCSSDATPDVEDAASASPIEDLVGVPLFDPGALADWIKERETERQDLIAQCMLAQGFEYTPEVRATTTLQTDLDRSSLEFAQEYGYGIVAGFLATNYDPSKDYSTENSRRLKALTELELGAYNLALHGDENGRSASSTSLLPEQGCDGTASRQAFEAALLLEQAYPAILRSADEMFADSRMVNLVDEWSRCMALAGFPQENPMDVQVPFFEEITNILTQGNALAFSPDELPPEVLGQTSGIMGQFDGFGVLPPFNEAGQKQMDALMEIEIGTAVADHDCSAIFDEEAGKISQEYQQTLLDELEESISDS